MCTHTLETARRCKTQKDKAEPNRRHNFGTVLPSFRKDNEEQTRRGYITCPGDGSVAHLTTYLGSVGGVRTPSGESSMSGKSRYRCRYWGNIVEVISTKVLVIIDEPIRLEFQFCLVLFWVPSAEIRLLSVSCEGAGYGSGSGSFQPPASCEPRG
jgi:hypothetical protein